MNRFFQGGPYASIEDRQKGTWRCDVAHSARPHPRGRRVGAQAQHAVAALRLARHHAHTRRRHPRERVRAHPARGPLRPRGHQSLHGRRPHLGRAAGDLRLGHRRPRQRRQHPPGRHDYLYLVQQHGLDQGVLQAAGMGRDREAPRRRRAARARARVAAPQPRRRPHVGRPGLSHHRWATRRPKCAL